MHRKVTKMGGSLGVVIPRDLAEAMGVTKGSSVRLTLVGKQMVIEPENNTATDAQWNRAMAAVLRRRASMFKGLADHDAGRR